MKPVLILKVGTTLASIKTQRGDFEDWFAKGLNCPVEVCDAHHTPPPDPASLAAVVVTGSGAMVSARERWSEQAAVWLKRVVRLSVPVLGVCYGHQLLAHALGGHVGKNPLGREIGTKALQPMPAMANDPLFKSLKPPVQVQTSHEEAVLKLPTKTQILATTEQDPHHVLRFTETAWGVQFHPEFDARVMAMYLQGRREKLRAEGLDVEQLLNEVRPTPQAWALLQQFAKLFA